MIGGGWAARFLLNGVDVRIYDPDPQAAVRLGEMLENARRAYARLTLAPLPAEGTLSWAGSPADAVAGADLVQESAPERLELKQRLLADASATAGPDTIFCSSTSGLLPTLLAAEIADPQRFVVAHPFNPVYLLPLVELCGGEHTDPGTLERAAHIYRSVGMRPIMVRTEIDGFIADRLLEALWREALWLVHDDVATVEEIDDAIRFGAGLRWAFMGTFLTYRIAGGEDGMRHFVEHFGPTLSAPWTKLVDVPQLTSEFLEKLVAQSDAQARGQSTTALERTRDDCLVALLHALRGQRVGAGESIAEWERGLLDAPGAAARDGDSAPLSLLERVIPPEWIDYNGHVTESAYLQLFGDASDALFRHIGIDAGYRERNGSYYTVESHLSHLRELFAGDHVAMTTQLLGSDAKRIHLFHVLVRAGEDAPIATAEQMLVHVDAIGGRTSAVHDGVAERLAHLVATHAALPRPERVGRAITPP